MIMAHKVSYKVVSEQGDTLKKIAKDMDNYINQLDQIISKIGGDEVFHSVKSDLKKFKKQLEEERTVLDFSGQILGDIVQAYSGTEKKSVQKIDKAKAHNRDFYKRPVAVASAGGAAAVASGGGTAASASAVNVSGSGNVVTQNVTNIQATVIDQSATNIITEGLSGSASEMVGTAAAAAAGGFGGAAVIMGATTVASAAAAKISEKVAAKDKSSKEEPVNVVAKNEGTKDEDSNGE